MKERIKAFDFTRVVLTFCIIAFHFAAGSQSNAAAAVSGFLNYTGQVFVDGFFMLSGGLLYLNNKETSIGKFYFNRWKTIFPPFYIAYILVVIFNICTGTFARASFKQYIFTLLGMDGYLGYKFVTPYLVGEWFLGAIVICYLFMPFVIRLSRKYDLVLLGVLIGANIWLVYTDIFTISRPRNILFCLLCMQVGVVIIKWELWKKAIPVILSAVIMFLRLADRFPDWGYLIIGAALFILLSFIGYYVTKNDFVSKIFSWLGKISFCVFLIHHQVIYKLLERVNSPKTINAILEFGFVVVMSTILGYVIYLLSKLVGNVLWKKKEKTRSL